MKKATLLLACSIMALSAKADTQVSINKDVFSKIQNNTEWKISYQKCPAELMPSRQVANTNVSVHFALCAKNLSQCVSECESGNAQLCHAGAYTLQKLNQTEVAEFMFAQSCKLGIASGCTNRAAYLNLKQPNQTRKMAQCIFNTFEKACEWNDPWACTMSGMMQIKNEFIPQNLQEAKKRFSKSCKYGVDDPACSTALQLEKRFIK